MMNRNPNAEYLTSRINKRKCTKSKPVKDERLRGNSISTREGKPGLESLNHASVCKIYHLKMFR